MRTWYLQLSMGWIALGAFVLYAGSFEVALPKMPAPPGIEHQFPAVELKYRRSRFYSGPAARLIADKVSACIFLVTDEAATVTAVGDGIHGRKSAHYRLAGVDFRVRDLLESEKERVRQCSEAVLGDAYYIVLYDSPPHLHAAVRGGD